MLDGDASNRWLRGALDASALSSLDRIAKDAGRPGGRVDWTAPDTALALAPVTEAIRTTTAPTARLVRLVWFTKDAQSNWGLPWHQDRIIAVAARHDTPGFGNWSHKRGIWHCEPPVEILKQMLFVRLHLDACDETNGAMEIARGSEAAGIVREAEAAATAARFPTEVSVAQPGDIQVLPMLVLHCSRPAQTDTPRRALRLDYALADLPPPLSWYTA
jgi:hypothetical protein